MCRRPRTSISRTVFHAWLFHCDDHCADTQSALVNDVDGRTIACSVQERWTGPQLGADALQHAPLMPWQQVFSITLQQPTYTGRSTLELRGKGGRATHNGIWIQRQSRFRSIVVALVGVWVCVGVDDSAFSQPRPFSKFSNPHPESLLPKISHLSTRLTLKHPLLLGLSKWRYSHVYKMMI